MYQPGNQYAKCQQCVRCGLTRPAEHLKLDRRIDDVLDIDEVVIVCIDERLCARMKLEHQQLLQLEGQKALPLRLVRVARTQARRGRVARHSKRRARR